ncbi:DUF4058 family protein [Baaleninema sp.]|uniref:DUF4058 family protein n=1 Tax=Baaleninema sp. TaxID=3101197 RepID=UPI003CFCEAB7
MPSPFPGMNPYLEHPDFWSDFHNRFIVTLAEALTLQIAPKYRAVTDKRIYEINSVESLLVGRPDVSVQKSNSSPTAIASNVAVVSSPVKPQSVQLPMSEEVRESYLEVRDAVTKEVVTAIGCISIM